MTKATSGRTAKSAARHDKAAEPGGKLGLIIALLRRPEGADLSAMMEATGWQQHSVRGALAGALKKKKRGFTIDSIKDDGPRIYRIVEPETATGPAVRAPRRRAAVNTEVDHG